MGLAKTRGRGTVERRRARVRVFSQFSGYGVADPLVAWESDGMASDMHGVIVRLEGVVGGCFQIEER